jgi:FKBP-type peptidyl-prolyl cis-trans isomerase 2
MLQTMTQQGPMNVLVKEIKEDVVVIDANHPLAGKDLIFDLEVISVG